MEKRHHVFNYFFERIMSNARVIYGSEAEIYFWHGEVYKIFNSTYEKRNEETIEKIGKMDSKYLTIPTSLIYLDWEYYGFKMKNAGLSLYELLMTVVLSFEERLDILWQVREDLAYIENLGMQHGDIRLSNILYDGERARLGDINNLIMQGSLPRLGYFSRLYYEAYQSYKIMDHLTFNLITYLLLNFSCEEIRDILKYERTDPKSFRYMITSKPNQVFCDDIWNDGVKNLLYTEPKTLEKTNVKEDILLIDYLK